MVDNKKNHLPDVFYVSPQYANMTMTKAHLKETLLATNGWIMACGYIWDIVSKNMGAGIFRVTLERKK